MSSKKKILLIGGGLLLIALIAWANIARQGKSAVKVETQKVEERELKALVSASGKIRPKVSVDISAERNGKVVEIAVDEGDHVEAGDFLLQIDATPARATVRQLEASLESAKAIYALDQANLEQARIELERQEALFEKKLTSEDEVQKARTSYNVQKLRTQSSKQEIARIGASLENARHELKKVSVHTDISGIVTKRNIEEGENVFVGAFNNPATILLTIADLSIIEAVIEVDETDIVDVEVGQSAEIKLDAYPDSTFSGKVTKVGNSPIISPGSGLQQQATSFEVIVQLEDTIPNVRPGLSCKADITTGYRDKAITVPIQALTLKKPSELKPIEDQVSFGEKEESNGASDEDDREIQGTFVVVDDKVEFREVKTGIAGDRFFEVLSGLKPGDEVVIGPFREIRRLRNGDPIKRINKSPGKKKT